MFTLPILRHNLLAILPFVEDEDTNTTGMSMSEIRARLAAISTPIPDDKQIRRTLLAMDTAVGSVGATRGKLWYTTIGRSDFQIINMNVNMAMAMCALARVAERHLPAVVLEDLENTFADAQRYLANHSTSPISSKGDAWNRKTLRIDGTQPMVLPKVEPEVYRLVTEALFFDKKLSFSNTTFGEQTPNGRDYVMTPLAMVDRAGVLYLVAWGPKRPGQRFLFRMDRLSNVRVVNEAADLDPTFNLMDYVIKEEALNFIALENTEITLYVFEPLRDDGRRKRHPLREFWLAHDQRIEEQNEGFILHATVKPSAMLWQLLQGHGASIEVLEPAWIRDRFRDEAECLAQIYAK
jgi:predicted DNA-binding transcriptional regulator YafY